MGGQETPVVLEMEPLPKRPVLGLRFVAVDEGARVTWVHPTGPAAAEIRVGDILVDSAGESLIGLGQAEAGPLLAGRIGESRMLTLNRGGAEIAVEIAAVGLEDLGRVETVQ